MTDEPDDPRSGPALTDQELIKLLKALADEYGPTGVLKTLYEMFPDLRPVPIDVPPSFGWNTAHDLMTSTGPERALVLGLSLVSDQLDFIAKRSV